jgi:radical SAM protein with 4Fe4S-binding SPASM domain
MTDEVFNSIAAQLKSWGYGGRVILCANNEPFMDADIIERTRYMCESLPAADICLITNGTLMTLDKFRQIAPFLDAIEINNYSTRMRLHDNIREIVLYVKENPSEFGHLTINIEYRYVGEVLTNRGGGAPNKPIKGMVHEPCLDPFTSMVIYPDGMVGLCCFDAQEKMNIESCLERPLSDIWHSEKLGKIRELVREDRTNFDFCKSCDAITRVTRTAWKK